MSEQERPTSKEEYRRILAEIKAGLTGDSKKDRAYLDNCADQNKNHPLHTEIIREIGRMFGRLIEPKKLAALEKDINAVYRREEEAVRKAERCIKKGKLDEAAKLIRKCALCENMFEDDRVTAYLDFENPIEEKVYKLKYKPTRNVIVNLLPYHDYYRLYAFLLVEKKISMRL